MYSPIIQSINQLFINQSINQLINQSINQSIDFRVKIYIHDSSKDIFYELEQLAEIKDRTILKLFETDGSGRGPSGTEKTTF